MWDLRWVLLGLGALVVVGVYLWSKGVFSRRLLPPVGRERTEPSIGGSAVPEYRPAAPASGLGSREIEPEPEPPPPKPPKPPPDRIIALRLIPRVPELPAEQAVQSLQSAGLRHGRYSIFHRAGADSEPVFSVASLTEPGTFELDALAGQTIAGLSFFLVLPGTGDPVARFDAMVETARALSVELEADLHDESGSSWSIQRERYVREELIEYRHQLERH